MGFFRKLILPISLAALIGFFVVLSAESAHHHREGLQDHSHCTLCSFILTASSATVTPVLPLLFHAWVFLFLFSFTVFYFPVFSVSPSGRSPPALSLA